VRRPATITVVFAPISCVSRCGSLKYICFRSIVNHFRLFSPEQLFLFQVSLLKAIIDGYTKFSTAEVIRKYSLNSSANVRRVKDALMKKEIITFTETDERPVILDPLFEYWLRNNYFKKN